MNTRNQNPDNSWIKIISNYNKPDPIKSWWQLSSNLALYVIGWFVMIVSYNYSVWLSLALSVPMAGVLIRLFIIYHDCGHGSYFKSARLSNIVGLIIGIITFVPYTNWTRNHSIHHKTAGNLDQRGVGDVWTLTVDEYLKLDKWHRIWYRLYRHPITMFGIGAFVVFIIGNRFTKKDMDSRGRIGVYITNAGMLLFATGMSFLIGVKAYLLIQIPVVYLAGIFGFWLFYVQHQFDPSYWTHDDTWDYKTVAMEGSSFYKLPGILRWFTGNIGYHHIHHLSPKIPNYNLRRCHLDNEMFKDIHPLTVKRSFKALFYTLWDEKKMEMISFRKLKHAFPILKYRLPIN